LIQIKVKERFPRQHYCNPSSETDAALTSVMRQVGAGDATGG
jgi:hypothetical protein